MTKRTVTNGSDRTVVTKGTADYAVATAPDEMLVVAKKKVVKFNNFVKSDKLELGTSDATTIGGESIWTQRGWLGPPSEPTHGPGHMGTKNGGLVADGEAEALTASTNLKAEGHPVVRVKDKTWQNRRNTRGEVMTEVVLMDLSDDGGDESGGGALARGARGSTKKPGGPPPRRGMSRLPPSGTVPVDACEVLNVEASCRHGRFSPIEGRDKGLLQVVSGAEGDSIRIEAQVNGPCIPKGDGHPIWTGAEAAPGRISSFVAKPPGHKPIAFTDTGVEKIEQRPRTPYRVECGGCIGAKHALTIEAFEPGRRQIVIEPVKDPPFWHPLVVFNEVAGLFVDEAEFTEKPGDYEFVNAMQGPTVGAIQVREAQGHHRVYIEYSLDFNYHPFVHIAFSVDILELLFTLLIDVFFPGLGRGAHVAKSAGKRILLKGVKFLPRAVKVGRRIGQKVLNQLEKLEPVKKRTDKLREWLGDEFKEQVEAWMEERGIDDPMDFLLTVSPVSIGWPILKADINVILDLEGKILTKDLNAPLLAWIAGAGLTGTITSGVKAGARGRTGGPILGMPAEISLIGKEVTNVRADIVCTGEREISINDSVWKMDRVFTANMTVGRVTKSKELRLRGFDVHISAIQLMPKVAIKGVSFH